MYYYHYFIAEIIPKWYAAQGVTMALDFRTAVFITIFWSWFMTLFIYFRSHHSGLPGLVIALAPSILISPYWISHAPLVALGVPGAWICIVMIGLVSLAVYFFDDPSDDKLSKFSKYTMLMLLYGGPALLITTWFIF